MKTLLEFLEENSSILSDGIYEVSGMGNLVFNGRAFSVSAYGNGELQQTDDKYVFFNGIITRLLSEPPSFPKTASDYLKDGADLLSERGKQYDKPKNKYNRQCKGVTIDVYDVLKAFEVTDPALQHLIKKALCAGLRGHKNKEQDLIDILDSAKRALELYHDE